MKRIIAAYGLAWLLLLPSLSFAAAPSFIQESETTWTAPGSGSKTSGSFTVQNGDVLAVCAVGENTGDIDFGNLPTNTGTAFTWTEQQRNAAASSTSVALWTAPVTAGQSMTVSVTGTGASVSSKNWGFNVFTFRGSDGVGASNKANGSGAPSVSVTTTQANSAMVVCNGDWNAADGTSRTWRTSDAGTLTEQTYYRDAAAYAAYAGYHADAGATGAKAVGLSAPTGQSYWVMAVEIKGTSGGATDETFGLRKRLPQ